ncbi:putative esterase PIR7A [Sesamum alatum]|uniref:Esterase PIR7A n=1 Tax=Sesamum alatum TaxID=300844 RepID=A0AAE1XQT4_9LAMI|nr:putative esterase PIR7A [Sesamum alatum]
MDVESKKQQHFLLVHGICHGAWCWYELVTKLRDDGYRVTALDMAAAGANPKRVEELRSFSDYCQPLLEFMTDLPQGEKVVLVGHSMGGACISLAMEKFPHKIAVAVFLTALMPGPNLPLATVMEEANKAVGSFGDTQYFYGNGSDNPPTSYVLGPKFLATNLYQLSPTKYWTLATFAVRPTSEFVGSDLSKEVALSKENYGSIRRVFVHIEQDKAVKPEIQKWMIENNPPDEVNTIAGADHMVMFSKVDDLSAFLQEIALKYC